MHVYSGGMFMTNLEQNALKIYEAIFNEKDTVNISGTTYAVERTSQRHLRCVKGENYFYVEQNPQKSSPWAKIAREGHQILWVLDGSDYIAHVRDGKFHDFR
jgi:hypothetical protein